MQQTPESFGTSERRRHARVPTVSFLHGKKGSKQIASELEGHGIAARYGHFYAYRLIRDLGISLDDGVVRISLVHYNSPSEVARLVEALAVVL